jgi:hypothetical protein
MKNHEISSMNEITSGKYQHIYLHAIYITLE